jgi:type I restriction enzyme S subunit
MEKVILSSIIDIISGGTPKTSVKEYWEGGTIGWLSVTDFNNDYRIVYHSDKKITSLGLKNSSTKLLKQGDIIISARGTVGVLAQIGTSMCFNQSCFGLRGKEGIVINDFLYYCLKNYVGNIVKRSHGSVFNTINLNSFDLMQIDIPNLQTQQKIAKTLSALDSKIELNNRINRELEGMAKLLYDYWFVQFDFPDANGQPYKSSGGEMVYSEVLKRDVPKDWEVKSINQVIDVKDGTHDSPKPSNAGKYLITSKHLNKGIIDFKTAYFISENDYIDVNKRSKVDTGDILISMIGTIGLLYFIKEENIDFAIKNIGLFKTSQKIRYSEYIYMYVSSVYGEHYFKTNISGTTQKYLTLGLLRKMPILIPPNGILDSFRLSIKPIFDKIYNHQQENQELTFLRDWLLPMLMNGQVEVMED